MTRHQVPIRLLFPMIGCLLAGLIAGCTAADDPSRSRVLASPASTAQPPAQVQTQTPVPAQSAAVETIPVAQPKPETPAEPSPPSLEPEQPEQPGWWFAGVRIAPEAITAGGMGEGDSLGDARSAAIADALSQLAVYLGVPPTAYAVSHAEVRRSPDSRLRTYVLVTVSTEQP